jgi:protein KRI1
MAVKEKYGSDAEENDSEDSEDETEDEDGEELTPAVDAAILRTLARIKRKDPEIYRSEKGIFEGLYVFDVMESSIDSTVEEQGRTTAKKSSSRARKDKVLHNPTSTLRLK